MKDSEFFERVESIKNKMYRMAYPYFNSESMAVDVVDEAIYKGYLKKNQIREDAFFETWMVRILLNICNTKYKRYKRLCGIEEVSENAYVGELDDYSLNEAIQRLPEKYRQIIVLKFFSEYTITQICELLKIPQGTVASRLKKALELLKLDLEEGD